MGRSQSGFAAIVVLCLLVGACHHAQPIYQVQAHPVTQIVQQKITDEQMTKIILDAAATQSWRAEVLQPGRIRVTLEIGTKRSASADVLYNTQSFSIILASSTNMKQNAAGKIDDHYNLAVHQLEDEIERALYRASY